MTSDRVLPSLALPPEGSAVQFPPVAPPLVAALVSRVDRTSYDVLTPVGPARVAGDPADPATVGDWLVLDDGVIIERLPRRSLLVRGSASGSSRPQLLAANVDTVLLCLGLAGPLPLRRLERLLLLAWQSGAVPVVVLTKADLCADVPAAVREVQPYAPGVEVAAVSAATGDLGALEPWTGGTLVLLGASGAGKSTIVNGLLGEPVMATGGVREVDGKGRHTTTHRELLLLPTGGLVINTPGLRGVALSASDHGLEQAFADVEEWAATCRFFDCGHGTEPGCGVSGAVASGDLGQDRVDAWRRLHGRSPSRPAGVTPGPGPTRPAGGRRSRRRTGAGPPDRDRCVSAACSAVA